MCVPLRVSVVDLEVHLGAFSSPHMVANSILAGSRRSNACARNILDGILAEMHARVPLVRVDKHVWTIWPKQAQVARRTIEAAEIITTSCDSLDLAISPKTALCCSDLATKHLLRRGLLQLRIPFQVSGQHTWFRAGCDCRREAGRWRPWRHRLQTQQSERPGIIRRRTKRAASLNMTDV